MGSAGPNAFRSETHTPRNEIRRANGRNRQADNHFGKIISFRRIQCVSEFGGLSPETGPNRAFGMGIFGQLRPPSGVPETYPGNEKRIRGGRFVAGRPRTNSPSAGRCHRPGRANTQASRATQVTANRTGTAKASGREMASPSVRPGAANPARVRPDSGMNRFDGNLAVTRPGLDRTRDRWRVRRGRASSRRTARRATSGDDRSGHAPCSNPPPESGRRDVRNTSRVPAGILRGRAAVTRRRAVADGRAGSLGIARGSLKR